MTIDWLAASREERKALYRAIKRLLDETGLNWRDLYREALGQTFAPGHGYEDNFRSGRISRKTAHRINVWLTTAHPDRAALLAGALGDVPDDGSPLWDQLIAEHGDAGRLSIVPFDEATIGIVGLAQRERLDMSRLRLGQPFCFALDSATAGSALALQSVGGAWYPLPLSPNGLIATVHTGRRFLPRDQDGAPIGLAEDTHTGVHRFVVLIVDDDTSALMGGLVIGERVAKHALDALARRVADQERYAVLCAECLFIA